MEASRPGMEPEPQLWQQPDAFNSLHHAGDWTWNFAGTWATAVGSLTYCTIAGTYLSFLKDSFAGCKILGWQVPPLPQHLEYIIMLLSGLHFVFEEALAINVIGLPLYVLNCFLLLFSIFSLWLVSQHFGYDICRCGFLCTHPTWSLLDIMDV